MIINTILVVLFLYLGGVDFEPTHSTFEIDLEDKKLRVCDCIKLLPDTYSEGDETFQVSVTCARTKRILSSATVKINDDERKLSII